MQFDGPHDPSAGYPPGPAPLPRPGPGLRPPNTSRRGFLRGVVCSGLVIGGAGYLFSAPGPARAGAGARLRAVTLTVNGRRRLLEVADNETLAATLRDRLGLTGTKIGCNQAECGACTVMEGARTIYACSMLTRRMQGRAITTVEGIAGRDGGLHPVQRAFIEELAPQCGFCTPGQVVSAVALLARDPAPSDGAIRREMAGNLCRCGAYDHYLRGVRRAAGRA